MQRYACSCIFTMHARDAAKAQAMENTEIHSRIKLRAAISGNQFGCPGIGGPEDDWSIPADKFDIKEIIGHYLVPLRRCYCGEHLVPEWCCRQCELPVRPTACRCHRFPWQIPPCTCKCHHCNGRIDIALSPAPVKCVRDSHLRTRICGTFVDHSLADGDGFVMVEFGHTEGSENYVRAGCPEL